MGKFKRNSIHRVSGKPEVKLRERMEVVLNFAYDLKEGKIRNVILILSVKIRGAL